MCCGLGGLDQRSIFRLLLAGLLGITGPNPKKIRLRNPKEMLNVVEAPKQRGRETCEHTEFSNLKKKNTQNFPGSVFTINCSALARSAACFGKIPKLDPSSDSRRIPKLDPRTFAEADISDSKFLSPVFPHTRNVSNSYKFAAQTSEKQRVVPTEKTRRV